MDVGPPLPAQQRGGLPTALLIFIMIWFIAGSDINQMTTTQYYDAVETAKHVQGNYSAWLSGNESDFKQDVVPPSVDSLVQVILPSAAPIVDVAHSSYWRNTTGFWNGTAQFYNLSSPAESLPQTWAPFAKHFASEVNQTEAQDHLGKWHWDKIQTTSFRINDVKAVGFDDLQIVSGHLDLEQSADILKFQFDGVHIPSIGAIYALLNPNGYSPDIRQLSGLVPTNWSNATAHAVDKQLRDHLAKLKQDFLLGSGTDSDGDSANMSDNTETTCSFSFYANIAPSSIGIDLMAEVEAELRTPTGISTAFAPELRMDGVMISQKCAVMVQLKNVKGIRADQFWRRVSSYAGFATLLYLGMLVLLVRQMESTRTPAGISSVSRWPFVFQSIMDSFSFTSHSMFGVLTQNKASMTMLVPGFLACILALMFEVRFTSLIHRIQAPEDALAITPPPPPPTTATPTGTVSAQPATSPPTSPLVRLRRILNAMTDPDTKFWIILLFLFIFILQMTLSTSFLLVTVTLLHSLWVPQIIRNVKRGTRKALSKRYVVGTSFLRALLMLYIFAYPDNIVFIEANSAVYLLIAWLAFQVLVLIGQEYLGASFFIPKGWVKEPNVYVYHPILPLPDPEAPEQSLGDCSICMEPILIDGGLGGGSEKDHQETASSMFGGAVAGAGSGSSLLGRGMRRHYAFTPCSHIMHTACLEQWMRVKSVCPSCRTPLPPL
ncbi:hypothetical protein FRB95_003722 [Tulasnella sp. JGI-2019a]|nr:hypothetical protein FRB95_003722 [Tulasnella sp. JGI-2019a]